MFRRAVRKMVDEGKVEEEEAISRVRRAIRYCDKLSSVSHFQGDQGRVEEDRVVEGLLHLSASILGCPHPIGLGR